MKSKYAFRLIRVTAVCTLLFSLVRIGSGVARASTTVGDKATLGPTHAGLDGNVTVGGIDVVGSTGDSLLPLTVGQIAGSAYAPPAVSAVNKERLLVASAPKIDKT